MATLVFVLLCEPSDATVESIDLNLVLTLEFPQDPNSIIIVPGNIPVHIRLDIRITASQNIPTDLELAGSLDQIRH